MSAFCPEGCPDGEAGPCVVGHPCALHPKRARRPVSVRKTGAKGYEWEARCTEHTEERFFFHISFGAVAFNTKGVGNRLWFFAQYAADRHIKEFHGHAQ